MLIFMAHFSSIVVGKISFNEERKSHERASQMPLFLLEEVLV